MIDYRIDGTKIELHPDRVAAWQRGENIYPLYLEVSPSGACNHRCTFCAVDYLGYKAQFLNAEVMVTRLAEMGRLGVKSIMWAGEGEPLLHNRLSTMILAGHQAGIDQAITTNGIAMHERFCDEALVGLTWVKVSINGGCAEDYERIHQCGKQDWLRLWVNLARAVRVRGAQKMPVTLGAQMVLLPDNVGGAHALARFCQDTGLDYLVLKPYSQHPKSETRRYAGLNYEQFEDIIASLEAMSTPTFSVFARRETMERVTGEREYDRCRATPHFWAYVMATGDVYSCSAYLGDDRFKLGNLITHTFADIWQGERHGRHAEFVRKELDISRCRLACRMDKVNSYLHRLETPKAHDNFI